jgi:c-di-GMP-related signal transduction protein
MEVYAARQPIFDRSMKVYGYELLYRRSMNNFYEGIDDNQATAELISNAFLTMKFDALTNGTKAFINFSQELLEKEIPLLLPKEQTVIEILERVEPVPSVIEACRLLKKSGYTIALDDFVFQDSTEALIEVADIIKVEFPVVPYEKQQQLIDRYRHRIMFLAEKIETRAEHRMALDMGYSLFQGYFYSKPVIVKGKGIGGLNANLSRILQEVNKEETDYQTIAEIIEKDLGLSFMLLRLSNTGAFGAHYKIYSIKQALVRLGIDEIKKWVYLMLLKEAQSTENHELIKNSMVRAKMMELLAIQMGFKQKHLEFFMAGVFSSIDVLLNQPMKTAVEDLPLTNEVREALVGNGNEIRKVLDHIIRLEMADWNNPGSQEFLKQLGRETYMRLYIKALRWAMELDY